MAGDDRSSERKTRDERTLTERSRSAVEELTEGSTVDGKYRLVRRLGEGGMGAVFEAQNLDTLKRCAVKLILTKFAGNEHHRARFFREARASSVADSEHIVQVFDCDTDRARDVPYMVMEMLVGESLHHTIERLAALDPDAAARIALQAAAGLSRAHAASIVHRDIKPANLFLTHTDLGDVVVKVLDFGIAKMRLEQGAGLTQTGSTVGTPVYVSPEQALATKDIDAGADVWSLGVVMFEMLTGTIPFTADSGMALMLKVASEEVPHVQDRAAWVPPELARVVHRCLTRDRAKRYKDGGQLRDALAAIVPDSRLTVDMIHGASPELRAQVMPRITLASDIKLGPTPSVSTRARRFAPIVATGVGALALAIAVPVCVARRRDVASPTADASIATATTPAKPAAPAPAAAATEVAIALPVAPPGVLVEIDGVAATPQQGTVILRGRPGDSRIVVLRDRGKRELRQEVVIRSNGTLMPDRLELSQAGIARAKASAKQIEQAKREEAAHTVEVSPGSAGSRAAPGVGSASVDARSAEPALPAGSPTPPTERPDVRPTERPDAGTDESPALELPKLPLPLGL